MRRMRSIMPTEPTTHVTATRPSAPAKASVWKAFAQPAARTMLLFGFSSGLPFLLVAGTLAYWLKENGIVLSDITMLASAALPNPRPLLWAPMLDHCILPGAHPLG